MHKTQETVTMLLPNKKKSFKSVAVKFLTQCCVFNSTESLNK